MSSSPSDLAQRRAVAARECWEQCVEYRAQAEKLKPGEAAREALERLARVKELRARKLRAEAEALAMLGKDPRQLEAFPVDAMRPLPVKKKTR